MSIVIAAAAAALMIQPVCSWDRPGVDRYRGTPAAALANYRDIPADDRRVLAQRISDGAADDHVQISRNGIEGSNQYDARITDMHFGANRVCRTVTRAKWSAAHRESAKVYCVNDECVIVPQVCGNVSRVRRIVTSGPSTAGASGGAPPLQVAAAPAEQAPMPMPVYSEVPSRGEELPPWARTRSSLIAPAPLPSYPGPGGGGYYGPPPAGPVSPVPEPSTWAMLLAGGAIMAARLWRRKRTD
ncbi:putative secreted protein with PEP-CTERM sorting signal [Pseudoduganella lurida]|uniref:Putative secreted protein with PEP-CTERM sorting signal n=1 Tax=Pseudoduganella lurida TaxID=1036180 RepID=A0A562RM14_9BURK|nr:MHFG family PEP-CTERM protein [Pseudoduganella lurida]TWI69496.1 putative secreted protein with PEP-CTERM sorting signal [Pseudoduganella lurida]